MGYKLAIFDMDGTILDTIQDLSDTLNYSLTACGYPERTLAEAKSFVGNGIRRLIEQAVPENTAAEKVDEVFRVFNEHYVDHCRDKTKPYDGIEELIRDLRAEGVITAVVSNKADYAVQELSVEFFEGLFDFSIGMRDDIRKKPYPDSVNMVLAQFGIDREDSVYIGDSEVDLATAKNAEMDCLAVGWGFRSEEELLAAGATEVIWTMDELKKRILGNTDLG